MVLCNNKYIIFLETRKIIKNREGNENKMLKHQNFQKNKLYNMPIFNFFENN